MITYTDNVYTGGDGRRQGGDEATPMLIMISAAHLHHMLTHYTINIPINRWQVKHAVRIRSI